jgi:hypothetical protein
MSTRVVTLLIDQKEDDRQDGYDEAGDAAHDGRYPETR